MSKDVAELEISKFRSKDAAEPKVVEFRPISSGEIRDIGEVTPRWRALVHAETTIEDLQNQQLLSLVGRKLTPFSVVEIIHPSAAFWAELLVVSVDEAEVVHVVLQAVALPEPKKMDRLILPPGYTIKQDPISGLYSGFRDKDGICMTGGGLPTWNQARAALISHNAVTRP